MSTEYTALYRKYRPHTFDDVVGQQHVVTVLQKAIANKKVAHAYLFAGSRGTGKTTIARILAHEIGTSDKDIYEMDAASNRKIDDFRELNDSVHTLPFESDYKVYIIDEVHMLTKEAFNAFLKTLEEPPKHVVFVLATTEIDKLPDTIVSRCQSYTFEQPTRTVLAETVTRVAKKEKVTLEAGAAELIAMLAEGSFRDALGILQKVLSYSTDKKVTRSEVESVTGAPRAQLVHDLVGALSAGDVDAALEAVTAAGTQNIDMLTLQKLLLDRVRAVMLLRNAPHLKETIAEQFSKDDFAFLQECAQNKESRITSRLLHALLGAYSDTPYAYIKHLPLELAIIDTLGEGDSSEEKGL